MRAMKHPFDTLPARDRLRLFWPLLLLNLLFPLLLAGPNTAASPNGIVSLELAGTVARAQEILDSWDEAARIHAAFGVGLDYVFMLTYSTMLALACVWAAEQWGARWAFMANLGRALAWGQWLAAIFDGIENYALLRMLYEVAAPWPQVAAGFAWMRFLLLALGVGYILVGVVRRGTR
jgi:hypothetical protein